MHDFVVKLFFVSRAKTQRILFVTVTSSFGDDLESLRQVCLFVWLVGFCLFVCLFVYLPLAVGLSIHTIQVAFSWCFIFLSI